MNLAVEWETDHRRIIWVRNAITEAVVHRCGGTEPFHGSGNWNTQLQMFLRKNVMLSIRDNNKLDMNIPLTTVRINLIIQPNSTIFQI